MERSEYLRAGRAFLRFADDMSAIHEYFVTRFFDWEDVN